MNYTTAVLALALCTLAAGSASAHPVGASVDHRQARQHARIAEGAHSGSLTRFETRALAAEQRHLRAEERRYRADGHLTRWERADLQRDLNRASRHIAREKHDGQHR